MSPRSRIAVVSPSSFPRVSGDEPRWKSPILRDTLFSPRERG